MGNPLMYFDSMGLKPLSIGRLRRLIARNNLSDLSDELILCLIFKESSFDPTSKNPDPNSTAWGLMGITEPAAKDVGFDHSKMLDPTTNIRAGTKYLNRRVHWKKPFGSEGDVSEGLAKYGEGSAYAKSILDCEKCLKANQECGDDARTKGCLEALHKVRKK